MSEPLSRFQVTVYRAALGLCDWPAHEGCPEWETSARRIADRSMGSALVMGGTTRDASRAWREAFEAARGQPNATDKGR